MTEVDWSGCRIVQTNPRKLGAVPTVRDYRVPADTVLENHDYDLPDDEIAFQYSLPIEDVRAILAYAEQARRHAACFSITAFPPAFAAIASTIK